MVLSYAVNDVGIVKFLRVAVLYFAKIGWNTFMSSSSVAMYSEVHWSKIVLKVA